MKVIEQEIAALKNTINEMWALVHQQIYNAGEAMLTGDKELAYKVQPRTPRKCIRAEDRQRLRRYHCSVRAGGHRPPFRTRHV